MERKVEMMLNNYSDLMNLELFLVYAHFDFPNIFISKSKLNNYYINYYIEELENGNDLWFFTEITPSEISEINKQKIGSLTFLEKLYKEKRLNYLEIDSNIDNQAMPLKFELVTSENYDSQAFPDSDFFFDFDYLTEKSLNELDLKEIELTPGKMNSKSFKLILKDYRDSHEINLKKITGILNSFQNAFDNLATDITRKFVPITETINIDLNIKAFFPSSFGIQFQINQGDLFNTADLALTNLFKIIDDVKKGDESLLENSLDKEKHYSVETLKNVSKLLKNVSSDGYSMIIEADGVENEEMRKISFDASSFGKLETINKILKSKTRTTSEIEEVEGLLISASIVGNRFRIMTEEEIINGTLDRNLIENLQNDPSRSLNVSNPIKAYLRKERTIDYYEDTDVIKYKLINFE